MTELLVVTADPEVAQIAHRSLGAADFEVVVARDHEEGFRLAHHGLACIVVDLFLPGGEGRDLCHRLRQAGEGPIMALTRLLASGDLVDGMEDGADDYTILPAADEILVARVRSLLRRHVHSAFPGHLVRVRDLVIDQQRLQVSVRGRDVSLTPTEFRLLSCLAQNAGRVMPCRELMRDAQGYDCDEQEAQDIVKVHVNHLRQKIERDPRDARYIVNVRGFGYMLERRTASATAPA